MSIQTVTHVNRRGDARAALAFYHSVFGGDLVIVTYQDAGAVQDPAEADWVMWGQVVSSDGFHLMAYDVPSARAWDPGTDPYFVSVRGTSTEEIRRYWERLGTGGTIVQPLAPAGWAALYGMLTDRFGMTWVLDVMAPRP